MAGIIYSFDAPFSFRDDELFFRYKGIAFKLMNGGQHYQHYLLSIVPEENRYEVDKMALEFLGCLAFDSHLPVIYQFDVWSSSYTEEIFRLPIRLSHQARSVPCHDLNRPFPKEIPNLANRKGRYVISMYQEALISMHMLPHYAFLSYWKILEIIENTHDPSPLIWGALGQQFFEGLGLLTPELAQKFLKEDLRNKIAHSLGRGRRDVFILDPNIHLELNKLNGSLDTFVRRKMHDFFQSSPAFFLYELPEEGPVYMTEMDFVSRSRNR